VGKVVDHRAHPGDPGFGQAVPCTACSTSSEQQVARIFRQSVPPKFKDVTFMTYPSVPITAPLAEATQRWALDPPRASLLLAGLQGVGKTGLAICAMRERVGSTHCEALFLTSPDLLDRIRETYNRERGEAGPREAQVMEAVKSVALLVVDDLGAEKVSDWVEEKLFALVNHRNNYELATIFTSNLPQGELDGHVGPRISQRLAEMCLVLRFPDDAPNLRTRKETV
jgi:DNA replication protein DnaC